MFFFLFLFSLLKTNKIRDDFNFQNKNHFFINKNNSHHQVRTHIKNASSQKLYNNYH